MNFLIIVIIGAVGLGVVLLITAYNALVVRRNRTEEAWADIEVQLKRRYDLIPNLVETVKGYVAHERNVLERVTVARTQAMGAKTLGDHSTAENALTNTLKTLFAVAENYPELKANANFLDLQRELADSENKIQAARRFYNSNIRDYNTLVQSFPTNMIAQYFRFSAKEFFELAEETAREPVKVSFAK